MNTKQLYTMPEPDYAVPPGETLRMRLEEVGLTQAALARRSGLTTKHINQLVKGAVTLTPEVAGRFELVLGVPADWWLRLEADYRAALMRISEQSIDEREESWLASLPVAALVKVGALPSGSRSPAKRLKDCLAFFGVADLEAFDVVWGTPSVQFKQSSAYDADEMAVRAWLRLGEIQTAERGAVPTFSMAALRKQVPLLVALTAEPPRIGFSKAVHALREVGVTVLVTTDIGGTRAYGATRWLEGRRPVIQLSLRGQSDADLWVTLFHELGHIACHGRSRIFTEGSSPLEPDHDQASEEIEATRWAWDQLIPAEERETARQVSTDTEAHAVAADLNIGVSVLAAWLRSEGTWTHQQAQRLKRPVTLDILQPPAADPDPRANRRLTGRIPGAGTQS